MDVRQDLFINLLHTYIMTGKIVSDSAEFAVRLCPFQLADDGSYICVFRLDIGRDCSSYQYNADAVARDYCHHHNPLI